MRYLVRRIGQALISLVGVSILTFLFPISARQNLAHKVLGQKATPFAIRHFNHRFGLDRPLIDQYFGYFWGMLHGNLGVSYAPDQVGDPVTSLIGAAIWRSFWLAVLSLIFALVLAIPIGVYQAYRHNKLFDYAATGLIFIVYSTPAFLLSILLMMGFSFHWNVFPPAVPPPNGDNQTFLGAFVQLVTDLRGYGLPVIVLTLLSLGGITRFMRGSFLDTLVQDYVRTARAKGASAARVLWRHAFRNAVIPLVTILGLSLPGLFGGALITETIFNFEGMGMLTVAATRGGDWAVVLGTTMIFATLTILGNLLADISLSFIDPRVRLGART